MSWERAGAVTARLHTARGFAITACDGSNTRGLEREKEHAAPGMGAQKATAGGVEHACGSCDERQNGREGKSSRLDVCSIGNMLDSQDLANCSCTWADRQIWDGDPHESGMWRRLMGGLAGKGGVVTRILVDKVKVR